MDRHGELAICRPDLELFRGSGEIGRRRVAMQADLYRTAKDLEDLIPLGPAVRIVKGAYLEPPDVAYPKKSDVDENFYTLCLRLMAQDAQKRGSLCTSRRTMSRSPIASTRSIDEKRSRPRRTRSRCCSGSSAGSSIGCLERSSAARADQLWRVLVFVEHAKRRRAPGQRSGPYPRNMIGG